MKKIVYASIFILFACYFVAACSQKGNGDSKSALFKTTNPTPIHISNQGSPDHLQKIKKVVRSFPEIYDVAVLKGKKHTIVAYKVKHLYRFRMKAIEKKINKMLEKRYPDENFTVSSDYKIFLETVKLQEKMKHKNYSDKKAEAQMNQIIKLSDETT